MLYNSKPNYKSGCYLCTPGHYSYRRTARFTLCIAAYSETLVGGSSILAEDVRSSRYIALYIGNCISRFCMTQQAARCPHYEIIEKSAVRPAHSKKLPLASQYNQLHKATRQYINTKRYTPAFQR